MAEFTRKAFPTTLTRGSAIARLGVALSVVAGTFLFAKYVNDKKYYDAVSQRIKLLPQKITGFNTIAYPWEGNLNNWEGRRVEFEGYYKDDRFIVAREKDGKPGYLVFAPFVTHGSYRGNSNRKSEFSIIVCLGWIPRNHKDRIISDREKFADESVEQDDSEEESVPMTKVTGVLRPTEKFNLLKGAVNWESRNSYKFIDLFLISRFFRIYNIDAASTAYLQRVVDTEEGADSMPISHTLDEVIKLHEQENPTAVEAVRPAIVTGAASLGLSILL